VASFPRPGRDLSQFSRGSCSSLAPFDGKSQIPRRECRAGEEVALFALITTHPPDQCPTANSTIRKLAMKKAGEIPALARKHGIKFLAGPTVSNQHKGVALIEAENVSGINDFLLESCLIQWNSIEVIPSRPMDEALKSLDTLSPIY